MSRPGDIGLVAVVAVGLLAGGYGSAPAALALGTAHTARPRPAGAGTTLLATLDRSVPRYARPGVPRHGAGRVPATWHGLPSVLPVIRTRPGWVEVRLAQRPDGSTAWLPDRDVTLSRTPYRIVIDLATTHLTLYRYGRKVFSAPAGVGARDDPTPAGHYFVALRERPPRPNPGYGPFILVTSAHSEAIDDWAGSGDAVVGIHGPLGADREIGTTGARISHGCIRLHLTSQLRLRDVPAGTPVDVIG
jgi:lipoprotein-anchoring transpeptidase ErfK/SrfK